MGKLTALFLLPVLVCSSFVTARAQTSATLQLNAPIERTIDGRQSHEFTVTVEEKNFVKLVVEQHGIDLVVNVTAADGASLGDFDTPNGAEGPEVVSFIAQSAGSYRITVKPLDANNSGSGRYQIKLLEVREATDLELKKTKNLKEAKRKGLALVSELDEPISQLKTLATRVQAQLQAAALLRNHDDKRAARYLKDAVDSVGEALSGLDVSNEDFIEDYQGIMQVRFQVVQALGEQDPQAALDFLHSTRPQQNPAGDQRDLLTQENSLELAIANQIVQKDPNAALKIARQTLKQGYSTALVNMVSQLAQKDVELSRELGHEITAKLLDDDKLPNNVEAINLVMGLLNSHRIGNATVAQNGHAEPLRGGLLSDDDYKQLLQKAYSDAMAYTQPAGTPPYVVTRDAYWNLLQGLKAIGPDLDRVIAGGAAALQKRQQELFPNFDSLFNPLEAFQKAFEGPIEGALESIDKAPAEVREQLYLQMVNREMGKGNLTVARQIVNDHVTNPYQRRQILSSIDQLELQNSMTKGKLEEVLKSISAVRSPKDRAVYLRQLLDQMPRNEKATLPLSFLEQARSLLPPAPRADDQEAMHTLLVLALVFSESDPKRAFEIVDPLIDQFNDICAAASTMDGFGVQYYVGEELDLQNGSPVAQIANELSTTLGELALTNFDRAKSASEKLRLPEVRVKVYLQIAQDAIESSQ